MCPPITRSAPAAAQRACAAAWLRSRSWTSSSRSTASGWCTTTTRNWSAPARDRRSATRSICCADTWPFLCRQARVVLTHSTSSSRDACSGSMSSPKASQWRAYGSNSRARRSNNGMSWLPGIASSGAPSRSTKARAARNSSRRARCVMSPDSTSRSGRCRSANAASASTTGGCSVPKCGSETCNSTLMRRSAEDLPPTRRHAV